MASKVPDGLRCDLVETVEAGPLGRTTIQIRRVGDGVKAPCPHHQSFAARVHGRTWESGGAIFAKGYLGDRAFSHFGVNGQAIELDVLACWWAGRLPRF